MLPYIWGQIGWDFFHLVIEAYPDNPTELDKQDYRTYFYALPAVLPCQVCGRNLASHYKKYPLTDQVLANRDSLRRWGIDIHNIVNYYTGKKLLTYAQAQEKIDQLIDSRANPRKKLCFSKWKWIILLIIVVIVCVLFGVWYARRR